MTTRSDEEWAVGKNRWGDQLRTAHLMYRFPTGQWAALCRVRTFGFTQPYASPEDAGAQPCKTCLRIAQQRRS